MKSSHETFLITVILIATSALISFALREVVFTDEVIYYSLSEQFSAERIERVLDQRRDINWIRYSLMSVILLIKLFLISICVFIGLFLDNTKSSLGKIFSIAVRAEFVFLINPLIVLLWFGFFTKATYSISDIREFSPLSALSLVRGSNFDAWTLFILKSVNLLEILYVFGFAYQFSIVEKVEFLRSLRIVIFSYGTGYILWVVFVSYLILNFSN